MSADPPVETVDLRKRYRKGPWANDGITLAGRADVGFELAVLAGCALVTMAAGAWRLPWRED